MSWYSVSMRNIAAIYDLFYHDIVIMYCNPLEEEQQNFAHEVFDEMLEVIQFFLEYSISVVFHL